MKFSRLSLIVAVFALAAASATQADDSPAEEQRVKRQIYRDQTSKIKSAGAKERQPASEIKAQQQLAGGRGRGRPRPRPAAPSSPLHHGHGLSEVEATYVDDRRPEYNAIPVQQDYKPQPYKQEEPYSAYEDDSYGSRKPILINTQPAAQSGFKPKPAYEEYGDEYKASGSEKKHSRYGAGYGDNYEGNDIPGTPGVDYPVYHSVPDTKFDCSSVPVRPGMYADVDTGCQVYRICDDGRHGHGGASFLCTNGTIFNQAEFTCDWWYNVDCKHATELYRLNEDPYQNPFTKNDYLKKDDEKYGKQPYSGSKHQASNEYDPRYAPAPYADPYDPYSRN